MSTDLSTLIELQKFDTAILDLAEKAASLDPHIEAKKKSLENLKLNLKKAKERLNSTQLRKKELENLAQEKENLIKKHQGELNSLKSNDAYKAMLGEIQAAKDQLAKIEDEILELMESQEQAETQYKQAEEKSKADQNKVQADIKQTEDQKTHFLNQAKAKQTQRDQYAATVAKNLLDQYEAVRQRRGGVAIVPVSNNSCAGCHMTMPPHKLGEVKVGKTMVFCESCSRILYMPPEKPSETPQETSPAS